MTTRRRFAAAAIVLGVAAPIAEWVTRSRRHVFDASELASIVDRGDDHVDAIELGQWIVDKKKDLRVVDLRSESDFNEGHIPTAERMTLADVARAEFRPEETVVLYSEGGAHAGQAWTLLRARGHERVFFLRSGTYEWIDQVLDPALPADATDAERAAFAKAIKLSAYFDGHPRRDVPRTELTAVAKSLARRGC